jgi:hypothetical protein
MSRLDYEAIAALDLTAMTAAEIDAAWEPLMAEAQSQRAAATRLQATYNEAERRGLEYTYASYPAAVAQARDRAERAEAAMGPFNAEWERRGGWERVFLVQNHDGHYHRTTACTTCFATTTFAWVPALSDKSEDEVIATVGCMACTVCWPAAPRHPKFVAMEAERAAAAKAKVEGECEGSGQVAENLQMSYASPRGRCAACGRTVSVTKTGKARAHKTREQERIEEQRKRGEKELRNLGRIQTLAGKVDAALDLLDGADALQAIRRAWLDERITTNVREVLESLLKERLQGVGR